MDYRRRFILVFLGALTPFLLWSLLSSNLVFGLATEEKQPPQYQTRTLRFFIFQNPAVLVSGNSTTTDFSVYIGEQSPVVKDAYIEIRGVTKAVSSNNITADIRATQGSNCIQSFATARAKTFNIDSTGQPNYFRILYAGNGTSTDASLLYCLQSIIQSSGAYPFQLKIDVSGADVSALQARMVITYQFTPPSAGAYPVSGVFYSPIFDTAAVNGASFNWIMWKGSLNGGKIRLQLATSNSTSSFSYVGPSPACDSSVYFEQTASDVSNEIKCPSVHNNKRYFRYKVQICSNNCSSAGSQTPQVDDVIVNWSP